MELLFIILTLHVCPFYIHWCIHVPTSFLLQLKRHVVTIDGYTDVPENNEKLLLQAVAAQPVSVGICGSERAFQFYSSVSPNEQSQC